VDGYLKLFSYHPFGEQATGKRVSVELLLDADVQTEGPRFWCRGVPRPLPDFAALWRLRRVDIPCFFLIRFIVRPVIVIFIYTFRNLRTCICYLVRPARTKLQVAWCLSAKLLAPGPGE
jgi:hypothetical protein